MRRKIIVLLLCSILMGITGCSSSGGSQEEYHSLADGESESEKAPETTKGENVESDNQKEENADDSPYQEIVDSLKELYMGEIDDIEYTQENSDGCFEIVLKTSKELFTKYSNYEELVYNDLFNPYAKAAGYLCAHFDESTEYGKVGDLAFDLIAYTVAEDEVNKNLILSEFEDIAADHGWTITTLDDSDTQSNTDNLTDYKETEPFFSYTGIGDDVISGVITENVSYAHITHNGDGHFSVKGHHGEDYDLLVNTTEPYDGITLIYPNEEYTFEVTASGDWTIDIYRLGTTSTDSFNGNGDFVTPVFLKTSDVYEITTVGEGHFAVKGWTNIGYDLLVNTTDDNYSGTIMFDSEEDYAFFEITASRKWEIKPSE